MKHDSKIKQNYETTERNNSIVVMIVSNKQNKKTINEYQEKVHVVINDCILSFSRFSVTIVPIMRIVLLFQNMT